MSIQEYKDFSTRLVSAMKSSGYTATRSPSGICITTLSKIAGASEQICRRYIRGDALPDYKKIAAIATALNVSSGWLLFGEGEPNKAAHKSKSMYDDLLHYLLSKSYPLYRNKTGSTDEFANFVIELFLDVREIDTSKERLHKIIDLAVSSIASYQGIPDTKAM